MGKHNHKQFFTACDMLPPDVFCYTKADELYPVKGKGVG